jgi:hypothetical protein
MRITHPLLAIFLLVGILAGLVALVRPTVPEAPASLGGVVVDDNGLPVVSATVRIKASATAGITDGNGRFRLSCARGSVTASKAGYFITGVRRPAGEAFLRLKPLPKEDNSAYRWVDPTPGGPQHCGTCHDEIYREWAASAHASSATGRHFRDLYEGTDVAGRPGVSWGLRTEFPDGAGVCASCHAPALGDNDTARFELGLVRGVASRGVHCDFCHKVAGTGDGPPGLTHGSFDLRLLRPAETQVFLGPLDDVDRGEDAYSPLYRDSRYCASCHEGVVFGVQVYGTYSEWLASPARREGKQCQDCHMAATGQLRNFAPAHGGVERDPRTLASHSLFAGSQAEMLRKAVRVGVSLHSGVTSLRAQVRVLARGVGHRVPTGFLDRHLILVVEGFDATGCCVPARGGAKLPAAVGGELDGRAGRLFGRLRSDFAGRSPAPFWRAGTDGEDTRLTPEVVDVSDFAFPAKVVRVRVRLLYRRFWQEVIVAKGWPDVDVVVSDQTLDATAQPAPPG